METLLERKEKKLLAHLFAAIADVLAVQGGRDLIISLSKRIAEIICERNLQIDTNLALLSLLEDLSAWSVCIIKTNVLKGTLELKAIEMKVGKFPEYIDPYRVISELQVHSSVIKELAILPPSPPPETDCLEEMNLETTIHHEDPVVSVTTPLSLGSFSDSSDPLSSSPPGPFDNFVLTPVSATFSEHDNRTRNTIKNITTVEIDINPCRLPKGKFVKIINCIGSMTGTDIKLTVTKDEWDESGYVTVTGTTQNCKYASEEIERVISNLSVQEGKRYILPNWMNGDMFTLQIQGIVEKEGCTSEVITDINTNRMSLLIQSSRSWNVRRCVEKLQEFEEQHSYLNTKKSVKNVTADVAHRVSYDRSELLLFRKTISSINNNESLLVKELIEKTHNLNMLAVDHSPSMD